MNSLEALKILGANPSDDLRTIKAKFCELALQNHPDVGGDIEVMKTLNLAYEFLREHHNPLNGPSMSSEDRHHVRYDIDPEMLAKAIKIRNLDRSLDVSIAGAWVWVVGETKPIKEQLKAESFRWAPQKKAWYFAGCRSSGRGKWSLDEVFTAYGKYQPAESVALNA